MEPPEELARPTADALQALANDGQLGWLRMVTGFVLYAEGFDEDGDRTWALRTMPEQLVTASMGQLDAAGYLIERELEQVLDPHDEDDDT